MACKRTSLKHITQEVDSAAMTVRSYAQDVKSIFFVKLIFVLFVDFNLESNLLTRSRRRKEIVEGLDVGA